MADRINMINTQGQMINIDASELDAARSLGYRSPGEIMTMSHQPGQDMGVQPPEKPGMMESIIHGAAGMLGPYAAAAGGVPVGNSFAGMAPGPSDGGPSQGFGQNLEAAQGRRQDALEEHPLAYTAGSFASPESMALGEAGGAIAADKKAANLSRGLSQGIRNFRPQAAVKAAMPTWGDARSMFAGHYIGGALGMPIAGTIAGITPYISRIMSDPRIDYQAARMLPGMGRVVGAGADLLDTENR
jgi:hypothetical protein